jgi:ATP-dependent DNA helicase RecQ
LNSTLNISQRDTSGQHPSYNIQQILTKYWGYSHFRPLQEEIINSVLEGNDTLALLTTGGGKSVCYQIPGLAKEGICIVISPLIALMNDQVDFLTRKGIRAVMVHSSLSSKEIDNILDNCIHGNMKFLYVSPERLDTDLFIARVQQMNVNLIAVDEAHCISQWGYDFRPSYMKIAELRKWFPKVPVLAVTATATPEVAIDIQEKLGFKKENLLRKSFERKNLSYVVLKEEAKASRLLKIVNNVRGSGIIYVRNRRKAEEVSNMLKQQSIAADYYHAGLNFDERSKRQEAWVRDKTRVIVCTNAFGMGINKANVRFVVHLDLPDSLEAYFQEAGRAGRDDKRAYAVLLYNDADRLSLERNMEHSFPELEDIKRVYGAICSYYKMAAGGGKGSTFDFPLNDFCSKYNLEPSLVVNSIKFLERENYLALTEAFYRPSRIHMLVTQKDLYRYQVEVPAYDAFIKLLLRSYEGLFEGYINIKEYDLAKRSTLTVNEVENLLQRLDKKNILSYIPQSDKPQLVFTDDCHQMSNLHISKQHYHELKERALKRMEWVIHYAASTHKCRSEMLLAYFGEIETVRCGICDVCIERNKLELSDLEFETVAEQLKSALHKKPLSLSELVHSVQQIREDKILKTVQWLTDNGKLTYNDDNLLEWKK